MLNVWGGHGLLRRDWKTGDLYQIPRKRYTRTHAYPATTTHFSALPREKSAIIKLRNFGYPIQHLAKVFGRSTSFIHKTLREARSFGLLKDTVYDKRKCPRMACLLGSRK
jgi:hypothetical protein